MDADFEKHYQAAERAYSLGEYSKANALALELRDRLESASDEHDPSIVLGWRAVVSLLLGHIQLHGLQQPDQAALSYRRVLESEADATITALAEQGLERCRTEHIASEATTTPANEGSIPDLLKDPFLSEDPDQTKRAPVDVVTAMPWLSSDEEPRSIPTPVPSPKSEPAVTPEPESKPKEPLNDGIEPRDRESNKPAPASTPDPKVTLEPEPATGEPPRNSIEPAPQEPDAIDLLEQSWLRVQLQPEIKSPNDSYEPMGLINRIQGAFGRSAGR